MNPNSGNQRWSLWEYRVYPETTTRPPYARTPIDVGAWDLIWDLRKADNSTGDALIEKTSAEGIVVDGVYAPDPAINTQRVRVTLADTDSDSATTLQARTYRHALKRLDEGSETVLAFGDFVFRQATTR